MTSILNADLHCHSVVSDGTLTPEALAERAKNNGVELWALTDHDEIGGQARAAAAAKACGMDTNEVFRKYLTEGKPGYVEHRWATLQDAVRWITQADGMAIVAHPARYKFTANEEFALFTEFKGHGGRGVEVVTGSHSAAEYVSYAAVAQEFGLAASRGSDFHSP
ncbi:MAG: PHP domain-containing protein, partial [Betaproteobacteria bacterium]|nr:PHP domain-containing protein [Betaproteobacteria bacterium]